MAGPLSGIGGQVNIPQATQTQISQNTQGIREPEDDRQSNANEVQPQGAPVNETQETNAENLNAVPQEQFTASNDVEVDPNAPRGSLVDIAV